MKHTPARNTTCPVCQAQPGNSCVIDERYPTHGQPLYWSHTQRAMESDSVRFTSCHECNAQPGLPCVAWGDQPLDRPHPSRLRGVPWRQDWMRHRQASNGA